MTRTIPRHRPVVIAANPATVEAALIELGHVGVQLQRSGGVERLQVFTSTAPNPASAAAVIAELGLPKRLVEVLELTAEGLSRREIGTRLFLSEATVKSHLARLYARLGVNGRETAVAAGFRLGILGGGA